MFGLLHRVMHSLEEPSYFLRSLSGFWPRPNQVSASAAEAILLINLVELQYPLIGKIVFLEKTGEK